MIDLIKRLRAKRVWGQLGDYNPDELCQEAADEIERLRADNKRLHTALIEAEAAELVTIDNQP